MIDKPCTLYDDHKLNLTTYIDPIFETNPLLTPYYRKINQSKDTYWYIDINFKTNATPYHFFVLTTRLRYHVPLEYEIDYKTYQYNNVMKYIVDVPYDKKYQDIINDIILNHHDHCMFLHMDQSFINKNHNKPLPNHWVISVLPYCYHQLIDEQYDPILKNNYILININPDNKYKDDQISIVDDYFIDYNKVYNKLQDIVIDKLYNMYINGSVVASGKYDVNVINKYKMFPVYNTNTDVQLYMTDLYIPNKSEFLMYQLKK